MDKIKEMFEEASIDKKTEFLFDAIMGLRDDVQNGFMDMKKVCECRKNKCHNEFVTKKQSRLFGVMASLFAVGVGVGAGYITFAQLIKMGLP